MLTIIQKLSLSLLFFVASTQCMESDANLIQQHNAKLLIMSSTCDNYTAVCDLLNKGAYVNSQDAVGNTPLHRFLYHYCNLSCATITLPAGVTKSQKVFKKLLEYKADVCMQNNLNITPLHIAAHHYDLSICSDLVDYAQEQDQELNRKFNIAQLMLLINTKKQKTKHLWLPKPVLLLIISQIIEIKVPQQKEPLLILQKMLRKENHQNKTAFKITSEKYAEAWNKLLNTKGERTSKEYCITRRFKNKLEKIKTVVNPDNPKYK